MFPNGTDWFIFQIFGCLSSVDGLVWSFSLNWQFSFTSSINVSTTVYQVGVGIEKNIDRD